MTNVEEFANRVWIPKGAQIEFGDGFFDASQAGAPEPSVNYLRSLRTDVLCIVLLGPPGIGKSSEFKRAVDRLDGAARLVPLSSITSFSELDEGVDVALRLQAAHTFLFLDALDECP